MPMPIEYAHASQAFDRFMKDAMEQLDHVTRHQTYQTVESVLRVFRRRLTGEEVLIFANVLPAVLRAIFVGQWNDSRETRPFTSLAAMNREVQERRINHDFSPDNSIEIIASVLRNHVDARLFDATVRQLSPQAAQFWAVPDG